MQDVLRIRVAPFSFGRALALHAAALSLPRPGPLVVQLHQVTAPTSRPLAPEVPETEGQVPLPRPVPKKTALWSR